ncbi:putative DNA helicase chromatin remodeling SNF2 family [Helianthus annuus]|nr:putative DNA helicase chromatin remodeling SNF2 family [Helianthus annuus]
METPEGSRSSVKRRSTDTNETNSSTTCLFDAHKNRKVDTTNPFALRDWVVGLDSADSAEYGSVTKDIEYLVSLRKQMLAPVFTRFPSLREDLVDSKSGKDSPSVNDDATHGTNEVIVIDSDDDEPSVPRPIQPDPDVAALNNPNKQVPVTPLLVPEEVRNKSSRKRVISLAQLYADKKESDIDGQASMQKRSEDDDVESEEDKMEEDDIDSEEDDVGSEEDEMESSDDVEVEDGNNIEDDDVEVENTHDKGVYVGVEEDESNSQSDTNLFGEADLWNEMSIGLESLKEIHPSSDQKSSEDEQECDHSYILKDDIGYVCRVCGLIQTPIDSIIEFQRPKSSKSIRTYYYEGQKNRSGDASLDGVKLAESEFSAALEFTVHPRHQRQMKPHQVAGFKFLLSNLVSENPGGCILAHAPGSGKTFMLISFIQSFMAKYPDARPLVILPRGILGTWKKEFIKWQVEDLPLLDMYSLKAEGRTQQLQVLKKWANQRSILFLGYQHFSSIVCDNDTKPESVNCQEILLTRPSLLILDEGHTARNKQTNIYIAIDKVQTPRKVVLSGTLYQNNVTEVFNTLNLVRPKFLKMEKSKAIKRRILSMVEFKSHTKKDTENEFYELVKHTLLKDDNFKRKVAIIENLREMTNSVLHYYKGDLLDELPGLVDFSVFLKLTPNQVRAVSELKKVARNNPFKVSSDGSAIYVHPGLESSLKNSGSKERNDEIDEKIDELLENVDGTEGVKAKFFINMLRLCESAGEKLLVFGQFLLPLKFLVGLTVKTKGWSVGKQIFMITGDHDNDERELAMDRFNNSSESRVFFGSIKACGEGISLVGASRIIILDVHLNPSVTRQAIGRAFRPGQMKKVYVYRLIAAESPEEEDHATCFKKESIAKMLFEWNEYCGHHDFKMETISVEDCGDRFLETACLNEDITAVSKSFIVPCPLCR